MCHIMSELHVCKLKFHVQRWRGGGGDAAGTISSRLRFNIHETLWNCWVLYQDIAVFSSGGQVVDFWKRRNITPPFWKDKAAYFYLKRVTDVFIQADKNL